MPAPNRSARAQPTDRAGGHLDDAGVALIDTQLRMDRPFGEPECRRGLLRDARDLSEDGLGVSRRRDEDRLFEVGTNEWIRLVEDRQHVERACLEQTFDGHLVTREVLLHDERAAAGDVARPVCGSARSGRIVGPDHTTTARESRGLHHAREADIGHVIGVGEHSKARLRHLGRGQRGPHRDLVPRARRRLGSVVRKAEALSGASGDEHALVVDRDDGVDRPTAVELLDRCGPSLGIVERHDDRSIPHGVGEHGALLRSDDDLDPERASGRNEIGGTVRRSRQEEKYPIHRPIMAI